MRETIAIDIDDVLSVSAEGFVNFSNQRWGLQLTPDQYTEEWAVIWGVSLEEALRRSEEFHNSGALGQYRHFPHALPVLRALAKEYDLAVITSRLSVVKPETDAWLDQHFPDLFTGGVHYAGMWEGKHDVTEALKQTKATICEQIGAKYLIDDQLKHCIGVAACGVQALLFGEYNWNQTDEPLPESVVRVKDWDGVARYFHVTS